MASRADGRKKLTVERAMGSPARRGAGQNRSMMLVGSPCLLFRLEMEPYLQRNSAMLDIPLLVMLA